MVPAYSIIVHLHRAYSSSKRRGNQPHKASEPISACGSVKAEIRPDIIRYVSERIVLTSVRPSDCAHSSAFLMLITKNGSFSQGRPSHGGMRFRGKWTLLPFHSPRPPHSGDRHDAGCLLSVNVFLSLTTIPPTLSFSHTPTLRLSVRPSFRPSLSERSVRPFLYPSIHSSF